MSKMHSSPVEIEDLAATSDLPARIAALQFASWGRSTGFDSADGYERFLRQAAGSRSLPAVLVARRAGAFLGSVNLLVHEMTTHPSLSPWLAQLFVIAEERGSGVGGMLVRACLARFAKLGFSRAHLYTAAASRLPAYYASLGWKPIEDVEYLGKMRTIMVFDFAK
jgi:GNAT superfamily N-acetyltransferase